MSQFLENSPPPQTDPARQFGRVLLVGFLWLFLPLGAFDADAAVGFEEATFYSMASGRAPRARRSENALYVA